MSSKYPILDNKPIDQWKVTELKEELKRRRLLVKGLKDDLIRRLDDALRTERVNEGKDVITGDDLVADQPEDEAQFVGEKPGDEVISVNAQPEGQALNSEALPVATEVAGIMDSAVERAEHVKVQANSSDSVQVTNEELIEAVAEQVTESAGVKSDLPDTSTVVSENVAPEVTLGVKDAEVTETLGLNGDPEPQVKNQNLKPELGRSESQVENEGSKPLLDSEDQKPQLEDGGMRSPSKHAMLDSSTPNNQVPEVKPSLGFQVKSDSISTDSMSTNEKIETKDNIISDNANLELDDIKPEMVEPSTVNRAPVVGESNPMDVEELEERVASVEVKHSGNNRNGDLSKKDDIIDSGYSEKLNLDRSSGDESMDEDLESKQIDSKYNSDDMGDQTETRDKHAVNSDVLGNTTASHMSAKEKEMHVDAQTCPSVPSEKRKFNDQEAVGSTEQLKRQRKWTSESLKVTEPQSSPALTTPKDLLTPTLSRGKFSRSDATVSNEDTQKERVVPPSEKPPTNSLRIDRFLRPFTLKAVEELLGKTGTVTSFWMDHIKTHCYVSYSSVEEAIETRNAVYNLQWPSYGGRLLVAEFVDPQEVKNRLEAPQSPAAPITPTTPAAPHQLLPRQQLPPPPALPPPPPPPPLSNPLPARERLTNLPPPPPPPERHDPPIVTLDDLFRKTRATPRIYYLPLTEEQVAAKLERAKNT